MLDAVSGLAPAFSTPKCIRISRSRVQVVVFKANSGLDFGFYPHRYTLDTPVKRCAAALLRLNRLLATSEGIIASEP